MSKRLLAGLILMGVAVLVLLLSGSGAVNMDLPGYRESVQQSFVFFGFLATGVVIGFLLR